MSAFNCLNFLFLLQSCFCYIPLPLIFCFSWHLPVEMHILCYCSPLLCSPLFSVAPNLMYYHSQQNPKPGKTEISSLGSPQICQCWIEVLLFFLSWRRCQKLGGGILPITPHYTDSKRGQGKQTVTNSYPFGPSVLLFMCYLGAVAP